MTPRASRRSKRPDPEATITSFRSKLAESAFQRGWLVGHVVGDGSERTFCLERSGLPGPEIEFLAKLSQSDRGWWGVMFAKGDEMVKRSLPLVLLTGDSRGYFIRAQRVRPLLQGASRSEVQFEINERDVRRDPYFTSLGALVGHLVGVDPPKAAG